MGYNVDKMRKIGYNAVFTARIAYSADFFKSRVLSDIYCTLLW